MYASISSNEIRFRAPIRHVGEQRSTASCDGSSPIQKLLVRDDEMEMQSRPLLPKHVASKASPGAFVSHVHSPRQNVSVARPCINGGIIHGVQQCAPDEILAVSQGDRPWFRAQYARGLGAFAHWLGRRFLLDNIEVDGLNNWSVGANAAQGRGMVILPTHTDLNRDPVVLLNMLRFASMSLPRTNSSTEHLTASIVAREPRNLIEASVLRGIARPFVWPIKVRAMGAPPLKDEERQQTRQTLRRIAPDALSRGEHVALFPQGSTYGSGDIDIASTGGTRALARYEDGEAVPMLPMGITYETLVSEKPRAFVTLGQPFTIVDPSVQGFFHTLLREEFLALNTVTASGLSGVMFMKGQNMEQPVFLQIQSFTRALLSMSAAIARIDEVSVDERMTGESREEYAEAVYRALVARGYLDHQGKMQTLFDLPQTLTKKGHLQHPLEFSGRRLTLQARVVPPLREALESEMARLFARPCTARRASTIEFAEMPTVDVA